MQRVVRAATARVRGAIPTKHLIITVLMRELIGGTSVFLAPYFADYGLDKIMKGGGAMFMFMGAFAVFGHFEGHMMNAVVRLVEVVGERLGWPKPKVEMEMMYKDFPSFLHRKQ